MYILQIISYHLLLPLNYYHSYLRVPSSQDNIQLYQSLIPNFSFIVNTQIMRHSLWKSITTSSLHMHQQDISPYQCIYFCLHLDEQEGS